MGLSVEEKKALEEHYKGKDIYDPSREPGQEPPTFSQGGMCEAPGYAAGGDVPEIDLGEDPQFGDSEFSGPALSADTDTAKLPLNRLGSVPSLRVDDLGLNPAPKAAPRAQIAQPVVQGAPIQAPAASLPPQSAQGAPASGIKGLNGDQFSQLMQYLQPSASQRVGQAAFSGLAGLADAIETGVARTNGSNFQKNIEESRQKQKENLLNALKAKYETKFKGQELAQGADRLKEETRQHDLEAGQRGAQLKFEQGKEAREAGQAGAKAQVDAAQKVIEAYEKGSAIGSALGTSVRPSAAEYNAAKNVIKSTGTASGMIAPLTATNKATGHKIVSIDGGKTWKDAR